MTTLHRPEPAVPTPDEPAWSAVHLAAQLQSYATFLAARLAALRTRTDPAVLPLVAELATAVEQLEVADAALRAQRNGCAAATAALATVQQELQTICDFLPDAYLVTDTAGVVREANPATSALVGYARTYVLGKPLHILLDASDADAVRDVMDLLGQARDGCVQSRLLRFRPHRSGAPRQVEVRAAARQDAAGTVTGYRWLLRDVTGERATAAALADLQATQAQALRTRTMELEAVVRMQKEMRALDQAARTRLLHDSIQALQHGAEPGALLAHVLATLQDQVTGPSVPTAPATAD
jgi:PAS domain S-box-containing protein